MDRIKVAARVLFEVITAAALIVVAVLVSAGLGFLTLVPSMILVENGHLWLAYPFFGAPWLFVLWRFFKWIRWNMRENRRKRLEMPLD